MRGIFKLLGYELISDLVYQPSKKAFRFHFLMLLIRSGLHFVSAQIGQLMFDQSIWESCFYSVPGQGSWGIVTMSLIWLALPLVFGSSCGLACLVIMDASSDSLSNSKFKQVQHNTPHPRCPSKLMQL